MSDAFTAPLADVDPEVAEALANELARQRDTLEMIASENFVPRAVLQSQGSVLTNKYAEGYPGKRYYGGCEYVDVAENLAIARAKALFGAEHANVQPHAGAQANALPDPVPEAVKEERFQRIMEKTAAISAAKLQAKIGRTLPVIIDEVGEADEDGSIGATGRSQADAPEIDGHVYLRDVAETLKAGDIVDVEIEDADEHDLFGVVAA